MSQLVLNRWKGVNEYVKPDLLTPDELAVFRNLILQGGFIKRRGGFESFNTNSLGSAPHAVFDAVDSDGNDYLLAAASTAMKASAGGSGSWSTVRSGLTDNTFYNAVVYNESHIFTNYSDVPFVLTGAAFGTNYNLEIEPPDVSATYVTSDSSTSGNLPANGTYRYIMCYVTETGEVSGLSHPMSIFLPAGTTETDSIGTDKRIRFYALPVSTDPRVTKKYLFRTKDASSTYYLVTELENDDTTYDDGKQDSDLDTATTIRFINIPKARYAIVHKERIFMGHLNKTLKNLVWNAPICHRDNGSGAPRGLKLSTSAGALAAGTYKYAVSFVDRDGNESELSFETSITFGSASQVTIERIPYPMQGTEGGNGALFRDARLYRTKNGGSTFYFLQDLGLSGGTTYDSRSDASLGTGAYVQYPKAVVDGDGRANTSTEVLRNAVVYSEIGKPAEFNELNIILVYPDDGDEITGLVDEPDGVLVFKKRSICKIFTTTASPQTWRVVKLVDNRGCDDEKTIVRAGAWVYFMQNKKIYRYPDSVNNAVSLKIINSLDALSAVNSANYISSIKWVVYVINTGSDEMLIIYDEQEDAWYKFGTAGLNDRGYYSIALEKKYGSDEGALMVFDNYLAGYCMKYNPDGNNDFDFVDTMANDMGIDDVEMKTGHLPVSDGIHNVRLRKLFASYKKQDGQVVVHNVFNENQGGSVKTTWNANNNSTYSTDYIDHEHVFSDGDNVRRAKKISYGFAAAGILEFYALKIIFTLETGRGGR